MRITLHAHAPVHLYVNDTTRIEDMMADLNQALVDLQDAVAGIATRFNAGVAPLQEALAQAQQALVDFQTADAAEDATYQSQVDALTASLNESLASAANAASVIEDRVSDLNAIGNVAPTTPPVDPTVDPAPVDPAPVDPAPVDPSQTL